MVHLFFKAFYAGFAVLMASRSRAVKLTFGMLSLLLYAGFTAQACHWLDRETV